uniref:Arrestin C-terminal-like domain-containing protein n=1 Tax=Mola mola TaxID=94237 RepID=A0A3Q3XK72_MOLML
MTVKHFSVDYKKVNERGTFSPGDVLSGTVTVLISKETKVQCLSVSIKGKARVTWCERDGRATEVYGDKKRYFYFEHIILQDKNKGDGESSTVGEMCFHSPLDMPSSYEGKWGKIRYSLRAQLTQSIWLVLKAKTEFPFVTKSEFPFASKISFFGSEKITMNVTSEKMGVKQGEATGVSVEVLNDSAHAVTPKFYLCEKQTFAAQSKRLVHTNDILFGTGHPVPAHTSHTVIKVLNVPPQLPPTFFNCCMMKLEYRLKVSLDVLPPRDPEVKLPLIILLGSQKPHPQTLKNSTGVRKFPR